MLATVTGALVMSTTSAANGVEQRVLAHVQATFGLAPDAAEILSIPPRDLPPGALEFYVEAKGTHGHRHHNCVVMGERIYCSRTDGEFARLLREQSLLERGLTAAQCMRLYSLLALPRQVKYIDADVLARDAAELRAFPQVSAPALAKGADGGAVLTFHAMHDDSAQPFKWTVSVSRSHEVTVKTEPVNAR
jgi:hypothetical protein